jgi:hypothetical protein
MTTAAIPPASSPRDGLAARVSTGELRSTGSAAVVLVAAIVTSLLAIYSSSAYLAAFPHGTVVMPWQFPPFVLTTFFGSGVLLSWYVFLRPDRYWATLVCTTVLTAGMFVLRFPIYDEWLAAAIAVGGALACSLGRVPRRDSYVRRGWITIFLGLCAYLLIESFVGFGLYHNLKALRCTITLSAVLLIGWTVARYEFPRPDARGITLLIGWSGLAYYALVLLHAAAFPLYSFEVTLEGIGEAGSSQECVAGVVAMPAALLLISDPETRRRVLGWILLLAGGVVSILADARGGMMCIVGIVMLAPFALRPRITAKVLAVAVFGSIGLGATFAHPAWILDMLGAMLDTANIESGAVETQYFGDVVAHAKGDAGRFLYVRGAVETLATEGPRVALMGAGTYGYFPVAAKHYEDIARARGIPTFVINLGSSIGGVSEPPRPPAMGVLIAETGVIGVSLLLANAIFALVAAAFRGIGTRTRFVMGRNLVVAGCVVLAIAWTYFGDAPDTIFFYLLIMPYGIVHYWSAVDPDVGSLRKPAARAAVL